MCINLKLFSAAFIKTLSDSFNLVFNIMKNTLRFHSVLGFKCQIFNNFGDQKHTFLEMACSRR